MDEIKKETEVKEVGVERVVMLRCYCGSQFGRTIEYISQKRKDPLFRWRCEMCDKCVEAKINKAFTHISETINVLAT
jgi:hypothetical protein